MPNNISILAYIQCMKDEVETKIQTVIDNHRINDNPNVLNTLRLQKSQLINLEKFIKGGK